MTTNILKGDIPEEEVKAYIERAEKLYHGLCYQLDISVDGEDVELTYHTKEVPFERIRRITGYLVGGMGRWNDAKRAEERDRVKHSV